MRYVITVLLALLLAMPGYATSLTITSPAFKHGDKIPLKFTCDGKQTPPELNWVNPPAGTKSFALLMYTPDWTVAPLYLWVVYNIPAEIKMMPDDGDIPDDAVLGLNYANENLYRGPCPPDAKIHHYIFDLFALDTVLPPDPNADGETVMAAMRKHILQETKLIGSFNH